MLKLYGFAVSNYFNMVKFALLEKGIAFETVNVFGKQQEAAFKAISPRAKVPCLGTEDGVIVETSVILEYLEERYPQVSLLPQEPMARAYVRSLMRSIELYIELAARPCYPKVFFAGNLDDNTKARSYTELMAGVAAIKQLAKFAPYVAGEQLSFADVYLLYSLDLACLVAGKLFNVDILSDWPEAQSWFALMKQNPNVQAIEQDKKQELAKYLEAKRQGLA